jgi:hypothetical protein
LPLSRTHMEAHGYPFSFYSGDSVSIREDLSAVSYGDGPIVLDGHIYICAGEIIFRNGRRLPANMELDTSKAQPFDASNVKVTPNDEDYYWLHEPELLEVLNARAEEVFPIRWITGRPLDHPDQGPYAPDWSPMKDSGARGRA